MNIQSLKQAESVIHKDGISAQRLYSCNETVVNHITFEPSARLASHTTPVDVIFYIMQGKAWVEIGNERVSVEADHLIESPADLPHALENFSDNEVLKVMVIKTPFKNE